jgi:hypothetical protein
MSNVIIFPKTVEYINDMPVSNPKTSVDYLRLCKKVLTKEDYENVCVAILDEDEYEESEKEIQRIVNAYYSYFENNS